VASRSSSFRFSGTTPRKIAGDKLPVLFDPIGQWRFVNTVSSVDLVDRSGYGRPLSQAIAPAVTPDLRPGWFCFSAGRYTRTEPAFRLVGAMSITLRAWGSRVGQTLLSCTAAGESLSTNVLYQLGTAAGNNALAYFAENGAGNNISWTANSLIPVTGKWQFFAFRRDAAGGVTLDLDSARESSPALALPQKDSPTTSQVFSIGDDPSTSGFEWRGGIGDVTLWDKRLSDTELAQMRAAMGL
jgi:hypothetical protein